MKLLRSVTIISLFAVACSAVAYAQSLKIRQRMAAQEADIVEDVQRTNKVCGSNFSVKFDWTAAPQDQLEEYSAAGYCEAALSGVQSVCEDAAGKDAVKQKIKNMTCGFAGERAIALKNGTLDYKIHFKSVNDADFVTKYLQNNL
jgi:hypothetical protein